MEIKFSCSQCHKPLRAREEQAGKKVRCPGCRKILSVPQSPAHAEELEALAAAALADPTPAAPAQQAAPIKFTCFYCDESIEIPGELAGKQTPCPHCRRIVKVPLPTKTEPRDWRKADPRGPAALLLKGAEAAPEGEWGTATTSRTVSQRALLEAEAIPVTVERATVGQWIARGMVAVAAILALLLVVGGIRRFGSQTSQHRALDLALEQMSEPDGKGADPVAAAEVFRAAGEYHVRDGKGKPARDNLARAQARLRQATPPSAARDAEAIDLALTQFDLLTTDRKEITSGSRYPWDDMFGKDIRHTLALVATPNGRAEAARQVARKLIALDQVPRLDAALSYLPATAKEKSELQARGALELKRKGVDEKARALAAVLLRPYELKPGQKPDDTTLMGSNLVALAVALDLGARLGKNLPDPPRPGKPIVLETRLGYAQGYAFLGKWNESREVALGPGDSEARLEALAAMADVAIDKEPEEARKALEAAAEIVGNEIAARAASPWVMVQLARLAGRAGLAGRFATAVAAMPDPVFRARAEAGLRQAEPAGADAATLAKAIKDGMHPLLVEFLARQLARSGAADQLLKEIPSWEPPSYRPFGYAGVALGEQDAGR